MAQAITWKKTRGPQEYVSGCGAYTVYKYEGSWTVYAKGEGFSSKPTFRTLRAAKLHCESHKARKAGDGGRALACGIWSACAN